MSKPKKEKTPKEAKRSKIVIGRQTRENILRMLQQLEVFVNGVRSALNVPADFKQNRDWSAFEAPLEPKK